MKKSTAINSASLEREFQWFAVCLDTRFKQYFDGEGDEIAYPPAPDLKNEESDYAHLIDKFSFGESERLILCLAMAPHLKPQLLDLFFTTNTQLNQPFTEFGGYTGKVHRGFLPSGETAVFLLSNRHVEDRIKVWELFSPGHPFADEQIIYLDGKDEKEPFLSGRLLFNERYLNKLTSGVKDQPESIDLFPVKLMTTLLDWEDLIISPHVHEELHQIISWIKHADQLMQDSTFKKHVNPGYRSLFYGQPGTGKKMAASLIGKSYGLEVYRIDLSLIVSKYIGETENNLSKIFDTAEKQNWILFFDEADALFGKRTQTDSSNYRFANQEIAYILQRIEDFSGIIILSSNQKSNMEEAFIRRFQSTIHFPMPDEDQRLRLWQNIFNGEIKPAASIDFHRLAEKFELSGGSIINILISSSLSTLKNGKTEISEQDIMSGIRKEFKKFGKRHRLN